MRSIFRSSLILVFVLSGCLPTKSNSPTNVSVDGGSRGEPSSGGERGTGGGSSDSGSGPGPSDQFQGGEGFGGDPAIERLATANSILAESNELLFHPDLKPNEHLCKPCQTDLFREHCVLLEALSKDPAGLAAVRSHIMSKMRHEIKGNVFKAATKEKLAPFVRLSDQTIVFAGRPVLARVLPADEDSAGSPVIQFNNFFVTASDLRYLATVMGHELGHFNGVRDDDKFPSSSEEGFIMGDRFLTMAGACYAELEVSFYTTPAAGTAMQETTLVQPFPSCNSSAANDLVAPLMTKLNADLAEKKSHCPSSHMFDEAETVVQCTDGAKASPFNLAVSRRFTCLPPTTVGKAGTITVAAEGSYPGKPVCSTIRAELQGKVKAKFNQKLAYFTSRCSGALKLLQNEKEVTVDTLRISNSCHAGAQTDLISLDLVVDYRCEGH